MEYKLFYICDKTNNEYDYMITKNHLSKALYALKNAKGETKIKRILINNNYDTRFVKSYTGLSRQEMKEEIKRFKAFHTENMSVTNVFALLKPNVNRISNYALHTLLKNQNLGYGKKREDVIYNFLVDNKLFCNMMHRASYEFSEFDFYGNNYYLFEVKSLTYSIKKYQTAVMNTSKLIYDNFIFIFEYTETDGNKELYFYKYEPNKIYNKRFLTPYGRLNSVEVIDIPINELTKFYEGKAIIDFVNPCSEIKNKSHIKDYEDILWRDEIRNYLMLN